nr:MAG TPA: hypothetical protein [Caudoviricetes sp.]
MLLSFIFIYIIYLIISMLVANRVFCLLFVCYTLC